MNITMLIYLTILFILLTPGQFITLPSEESEQLHITLTHAFIFGLIWHLTHKIVESSNTQIIL